MTLVGLFPATFVTLPELGEISLAFCRKVRSVKTSHSDRNLYSTYSKRRILILGGFPAECQDRVTSAVSSSGRVTTGFFAGVVVITSTLTSTNKVPRMVRRPSASPPRKYPSSTATTGFTYA